MQHITRIGQPAHLALPRLSARTFVPENLLGAHDKRDTRRYGGLQPAHGRAAGGADPHAGIPLHRAVAAQCRRGPTRSTGGGSCPSTRRWSTYPRSQRRPPASSAAPGSRSTPRLSCGSWAPTTGIHGEGEGPLAELIGALERGRTEIDIPSVYTRDGRRGSGRRSLPAVDRGAVRARVNGLLLEAERDAQHTDQAGMPLRLHLLFVPLDRPGGACGRWIRRRSPETSSAPSATTGSATCFSPIRCSTSARNTTSGWPRR